MIYMVIQKPQAIIVKSNLPMCRSKDLQCIHGLISKIASVIQSFLFLFIYNYINARMVPQNDLFCVGLDNMWFAFDFFFSTLHCFYILKAFRMIPECDKCVLEIMLYVFVNTKRFLFDRFDLLAIHRILNFRCCLTSLPYRCHC